MTAPVRIDAAAWGDLRFATLARLCGFADAEHALIKCAKIWAWQTEHYTDELPTYVVDPDIVESALGPGGAGHMVRARLADSGPDGLRIRGSKGRIEWLSKKRRASKCGGEATRRKHADQTGPVGLPVAQPQPEPQTGPTLGPLTLTLSQIPDSPAARAIPQDVRRLLGDRAWDRLNAMRAEIAEANGWTDVSPLHPMDPGRVELAQRIVECGPEAEQRVNHVLEVAFTEARAKNVVEYLSGSMFEVRSWRKKLAMRVEDAARQRAGPRGSQPTYGSSKPRTDHPSEPKSQNASEVM